MMSQSDQTKNRRQTVKGFGKRPGFYLCTIRRAGKSSLEPRRRSGWAALAVAGLAAPAIAADVFSTDWVAGAKSEARLIAAGGSLAGFEVRLAPGAITYWRDPGDAGVPPVFDFVGSDNVAKVEPVFPAPRRIRESDGSEAFGYNSDVVFPLKIEANDPAKPVTLKLHVNFAVCEKICLPAEARLSLTLPGVHSTYAGLVEAALAAAPGVVEAKAFGELTPDGADGWRLCAPAEAGPARDLFIESPTGWWISAAAAPAEAGRDCFRLSLREKPKDGVFPVALRLTMTGGAGPVETTVEAGLKHM
jgi:DsbC/DsbD-like thiol-disulfide interchange protein